MNKMHILTFEFEGVKDLVTRGAASLSRPCNLTCDGDIEKIYNAGTLNSQKACLHTTCLRNKFKALTKKAQIQWNSYKSYSGVLTPLTHKKFRVRKCVKRGQGVFDYAVQHLRESR